MAEPSRRRPANTRRTTPRQRKQQHMLDVAVRVDTAARQRKRWFLGAASKIVIGAGIGSALYFGGTLAATRLLFKNPEYNVTELNVETDGVLVPGVVIEASDLHQGANIFKVDLGRAKANIEALPQVESAQVARHLPNQINIQIVERKAVAWVAPDHSAATREEMAASSKSFLIDSHAVLLQPGKTLPQDFHLPIIRNYSAGKLIAGAEAEGEEIKAALDLLHAHQDSLIASRFQIQEVDLSRQYGLNVLGESGLQVLFGLDEMDKQLKRLDVYLQTLEPRGQRIATINLLAQHNIPVTFITEPTLTADPAAPTPAATEEAADASVPPSPSSGKTSSNKQKSRSKSRDAEKKPHHASREREKPKPKAEPRKRESAPAGRRAVPVTPAQQPFSPR